MASVTPEEFASRVAAWAGVHPEYGEVIPLLLRDARAMEPVEFARKFAAWVGLKQLPAELETYRGWAIEILREHGWLPDELGRWPEES